MATISNDLELWRKEAEEQAKKHSDSLKQNNQYLIDQLNQQKQNTLEQLQSQQDNAIYNLNTNKATINQTAEDNAKQANINRLLALKSNEQSLNRAGLGSQGIVGSQNASINNSYGQNLTSILNQKTNDLRELEKEKNDTLLKYNENRLNLSNEYDNNLANLQASIDDKALNQYNTTYNNYLAMKQQEWENEQNRLAAEEAKRQWEKEYALQQAALYNSRNSSNSSSNNYSFDEGTNTSSNNNTSNNTTSGNITYQGKTGYSNVNGAIDYLKENGASGVSYASNVNDLIAKGYLTTQTVNGKMYYFPVLKPATNNSKTSTNKKTNSNNKSSSSSNKTSNSLLSKLSKLLFFV